MESAEYLQIGSGPPQLTEDKKLKYNRLIQLKIFSLTGVDRNMEVNKDQF
jgi:hypothetical protein